MTIRDILSNPLWAIGRYYHMVKCKGALTPEGKVHIWYISAFFGSLCTLFVILIINFEHDPFSFEYRNFLGWTLILILIWGLSNMAVMIYGYHNRHKIDASGYEPVDTAAMPKQIAIAVAVVAILRILTDWLFD